MTYRTNTSNAFQKAHEFRNQHQRRQAHRTDGPSASRTIDLDGSSYWRPEGAVLLDPAAPLPEGPLAAGQEIYLRKPADGVFELEAILLPYAHAFRSHAVKRVANSDVLPKRMQKYPLYQAYPCTAESPQMPPEDLSGWTASSQWELRTREDRDGRTSEYQGLSEGAREIKVFQTKGGGYKVYPGFGRGSTSPTDFETEKEALWFGEELLRVDLTCIHCAQNAVESWEGVEKDARTVWSPSTEYLLPMISLRWLFGQAGDSAKGGTPIGSLIPDSRDGKAPLGKSSTAIREGFGWLRTRITPSANSSKWMAWDRFQAYLAELHFSCSNCLTYRDGVGQHSPKPHSHKLGLTSLRCPHCDEEIFEAESLVTRPIYADAAYDAETDTEDMATAGQWQLLQASHSCPACGYEGVMTPSYSCSSCDAPEPTQATQVVTRVFTDGTGAYNFARSSTHGYARRSWDKLPWAVGKGMKPIGPDTEYYVGLAKAALAEGRFSDFLKWEKSPCYPQLTPSQQAALLGSDVIDVAKLGQRR